ncbi:MAG TPA: PQQ-dependent sugar dehydrogenase [Longimicrobiales bacterium]
MRVIAIAVLTLLWVESAHAQNACGKAGLTLPAGFCATVFADHVEGARHMVVAPNGDVFVATTNSRAGRGGIVALRDTTGDGVADVRVKFGANGGSGIALRATSLYFATNDAVLRYTLPRGNLLAITAVDTIVRGLPTGGHSAKTIALGHASDLFVNIGSQTNSCQSADRAPGVAGADPCTELATRAGIWRFDASRKQQTQRDGKRYATGLRNVVALTVGPDGLPYGLQHGRDQLSQNWGKYFTPAESADKPAEIFVRMQDGDDYGWPYCFYDREQQRHVLAPEYGGDGKQQGRCANVKQPVAAFPGHWAPEAVLFYQGSMFPQAYRDGVFISFHGSWNRAPLPQAGYSVVYLALEGRPAEYQTFADGFVSTTGSLPGSAEHRPMGLAVAPDGALYIGDDTGGRIWRVTFCRTCAQP